ncbi:ankyrin repeat-containing domain protein [Phaeosphaeria sp. MPI-PUGE-AT-0046c]|nr:ankyrin repeat-containing domain protein [Phaeosphaeria sp. MPI-PUGE-AT-0046c]
MVRHGRRPVQVDLCYKAAIQGDIENVKEEVRLLLHEPVTSQEEESHPEWLYESLVEAIRQDHVDMVRYLLDEGVSEDELPGDVAVRAEALKVLELFLERGWDINRPLGHNSPPVLGIPLSTNNEKMTVWLLDHGADPNRRCDWDLTPTSFAVLTAPLESIERLFSRGADVKYGQLLHYAVLRGDHDALKVVQRITEWGAPVNQIKYEDDPTTYAQREPFGLGTPLHRAAESGNSDVVVYLLSMGADALKLDSKQQTPRYWAEQRGHVGVARILEAAELEPGIYMSTPSMLPVS